jgi:hypothetical protein
MGSIRHVVSGEGSMTLITGINDQSCYSTKEEMLQDELKVCCGDNAGGGEAGALPPVDPRPRETPFQKD